jgi:DNA repair protein RecN (Recombination protein N)
VGSGNGSDKPRGMLTEITIGGLGVIDAAELELAPGFTVVTGETGAGKTMVVTGLSLLLGGRADTGAVRTGQPRAVVQGRWRLPIGAPELARAAEAGATIDEVADKPAGERAAFGELIAVRSVTGEGRSRAHLGGTAVPVGVLGELGSTLVELHGQSDQIDLLRPRRQLQALDLFAAAHSAGTGRGVARGAAFSRLLEDYRRTYAELHELSAEHDRLAAEEADRRAERERLLHGLEQIEQVAPAPGEDVALEAEANRLAHADDLRTAAANAAIALSGDPQAAFDDVDVLTLLGQARKSAQSMAEHDERLAGLAGRLDELALLAGDLASDLSGYAADIDTDPARLAAIDERRGALAGLTRRYGDDVDAVLAWSRQAAEQVQELAARDERVTQLAARCQQITGRLAELAGALHAGRRQAAVAFGQAVTAELAALAMPNATVDVDVRVVPAVSGQPTVDCDGIRAGLGPDGVDAVELRLTPHTGAAPRPLAKGASGGELSRVMLACEVVLGAHTGVPTFVFDEVDAGVGGSAAVEVGARLAMLARHGQVLVVTHLAQVAAFADRHYVVGKNDDGSVTRSGVRLVTDEERVTELARMLAGDAGSDVSRAHARELLAGAAQRAAAAASTAGAVQARPARRRPTRRRSARQ